MHRLQCFSKSLLTEAMRTKSCIEMLMSFQWILKEKVCSDRDCHPVVPGFWGRHGSQSKEPGPQKLWKNKNRDLPKFLNFWSFPALTHLVCAYGIVTSQSIVHRKNSCTEHSITRCLLFSSMATDLELLLSFLDFSSKEMCLLTNWYASFYQMTQIPYRFALWLGYLWD